MARGALAVARFCADRFGRTVLGPALDTSLIRSMSLLIDFKQEGPFAFEVCQVGVFDE